MTFVIDFAAWGWPQWTEVGLLATNLILNAALNGVDKSASKYSAGVALVTSVIVIFILGSGGFFS
jgi:hypothetical protein